MAIVVVMAAIALFSCKRAVEAPVPLTLGSLGVTSDSVSGRDFSLVLRDGMAVYSDTSVCHRSAIRPHDENGMWLEGGDSLLCFLFNGQIDLPGRVAAADSTVEPLRLWVGDALVMPERVSAMWDSVTAGGVYNESMFRGYGWPVVSMWAGWCLPVGAAADVSGDARLARSAARVLDGLIAAEEYVAYDGGMALYRGVDRSFVKYVGSGFDAADYASAMSLRGNIERMAALEFVGAHGGLDRGSRVDSMRISVETLLRNPQRGGFNQLLYQRPWPIAFEGSDNLSVALGVVTGAFSEDASLMAVGLTPIVGNVGRPDGVEGFYPVTGVSEEYRAVCNALWCVAASRVGNKGAFALAFSALVGDAVCYRGFTDLLQGAVLRGVFGISTDGNSLRVGPFVPDGLAGDFVLHNFRYRDALLDIHVYGHGNVISTVTLDGEVTEGPVFPGNLTGRHEIGVTLVGDSGAPSEVATGSAVEIPVRPDVRVDGRGVFEFSGDERYAVYVDGSLWAVDDVGRFVLGDDAEVEFVSAAGVYGVEDEVFTGFACRPVFVGDDAGSVVLSADRFAHPGTRVFKDKRLDKLYGREFVESTRFRNSTITFEFDYPWAESGYVGFSFVDGLGIVNPGLRYSLRSLVVNGSPAGVVVFPQLTPGDWTPGRKWWERVGVTLPVEVMLVEGRNRIALEYFAPALSGLTDDANVLLPLSLRVVPARR